MGNYTEHKKEMEELGLAHEIEGEESDHSEDTWYSSIVDAAGEFVEDVKNLTESQLLYRANSHMTGTKRGLLGLLMRQTRYCQDKPICGQVRKCELSNWSIWGACDRKCDGWQRRFRTITQYANTPEGLCENVDLEEMRPCDQHGADCN